MIRRMYLDELNEEPIFLLGVGRCGSTFEQTWLNRTGKAWVWGEHDGVIGTLLAWGQETRSSQNLRKFCYPHIGEDIKTLIGSNLDADATQVAWMNGFNGDDIVQIERTIISSLFRTRLPAGRTRWGFKEIRYGGKVRVAERLLALIPEGKIVHTLRSPFSTVESSIVAWNFTDLDLATHSKDFSKVDELYRLHLDRWQTTTNYFLDLELQHPRQVFTSKLESFQDNVPGLVDFLKLSVPAAEVPSTTRVNSNARKPGSEALELFSDLRNKSRPIVADVAAGAEYII